MNGAVKLHTREIEELFQNNPFSVFLCGPSMKGVDIGKETRNSSVLRKMLKDKLESEGFEVILGEDEGLESLQEQYGFDAQTNECHLLEKVHAVVLIADSDGSFAELGLFSHQHVDTEKKYDFVLIISDSYEKSKSYVRLGPVELVTNHGFVKYANFDDQESYNIIIEELLRRLNSRRAVLVTRKK